MKETTSEVLKLSKKFYFELVSYLGPSKKLKGFENDPYMKVKYITLYWMVEAHTAEDIFIRSFQCLYNNKELDEQEWSKEEENLHSQINLPDTKRIIGVCLEFRRKLAELMHEKEHKIWIKYKTFFLPFFSEGVNCTETIMKNYINENEELDLKVLLVQSGDLFYQLNRDRNDNCIFYKKYRYCRW